MSVRIEIKQDRTVETGPIYKVKTEAKFTLGIPKEIFLFNTETQNFEHVATTWDMDNYPSSREEAISLNAFYFRKNIVEIGFESQEIAVDFAEYTIARVRFLAQQYKKMQEEFVGSEDYVICEED